MASKQQWVIGADPECDLVVDQPVVSSRHCRLTANSDGFLLEDLESTNGTYVNGQRLHGSTKVSATDRITLGQQTPMPWPSQPSVAEAHAAEPASKSPRNYIAVGGFALLAVIFVTVLLVNLLMRQPTDVVNTPDLPNGERSLSPNPVRETNSTNTRESDTSRADQQPSGQRTSSGAREASQDPPNLEESQPPSLTIEQLALKYENAIVWLGAKVADGAPFPVASGWMAGPQTVATTASAVNELEQCRKLGFPLFVFGSSLPEEGIPIRELRVQPNFDAKNPTSEASRHHNVGVAILGSSIRWSCPIMSTEHFGLLRPPTNVFLLGYRFDISDPARANVRPPEFSRAKGTLAYLASGRASGSDYPRLELELEPPPGTEGGAVFDSSGKVIGVFRCLKSAPHAINVGHLHDLLSSQ